MAVFVNQSKRQWKIRRATLDDVPALKTLYQETITTICAERTDSLAKRIESQYFIVAVSESDEITGFASFEEPDYLDMMYVHKDYQFQGIGKSLLTTIMEKASETGATRITSDVSITAKPFFDRHGFHMVKKQTVRIGYVELTNYIMENLSCKLK
ncbi:MAG: GNAT family N-acetyltransferase [Thermoguttaceae bacterium]